MEENEPTQRQELRLTQQIVKSLAAAEGSMFESLKGKRVYALNRGFGVTGILKSYGLDFIHLVDVIKYSNSTMINHEEIEKYERAREGCLVIHTSDILGRAKSRIINKSQIEEICELSDLSKKDE